MEARTGVSSRSGSQWMSQDFVIETHEQYPKRCVFNVFGEDRLKEFNIQVGDEVTVSFDIDAHEYNGRWFNNLRAWRVQRGDVTAEQPQAAPAAAPQAPAVTPAPAEAAPAAPAQEGMTDDLPF